LVVDEDAASRLAMQAMLAPLGYDIVEADSGRAALEAVLRQQFAVILMDVRMPIAIPDAILGKPGKLTEQELAKMRTHTTVGAQMLTGSPFALLELAEQIALTHHEKWDGSGYPAGLAGDAIPIAGRIVAAADVFDALTHKRPYKAAWSTSDAIAELTRQAGAHFDPAVIDAFLTLAGNLGVPATH
jgi:putative two-component system response regulator